MSRQLDLVVQGVLGTNPIISRTPSGRIFCYFRVATAPSFRVEQTWRDGPTIWFTAKAWGHLAENLARCLHKGDPVVLVGRFSQDVWENDRGQQLTNVLTISCGGHDLTWGESRFMRVSHAQRQEEANTTTSAGSAPSSASPDAAPEGERATAPEISEALPDSHWDAPRDDAVESSGTVSPDPLAYTVCDEALV